MKKIILFLTMILFCGVGLNAQQKIINANPFTTAGGDLEGTYPNPVIKQNIINRANLTQTLRDSLLRFRKDTSITVGSGTHNFSAQANTFGKYNRVKIRCLLPTATTANIILPTSSDTLKSTEFKVSLYSQDTISGQINVTGFGGFAIYYDGTNVVTQDPNISLSNRQTVTLNTLYHNSSYYWISEISKDWLNEALNGSGGGITALTGEVTASGTGSVATTITAGAVTTAKLADANVTLAKIAANSVNSSKIVDGSIALADMAVNSVDNTKIVDYSITGTDLNYLTLRAGDATNPLMRWTNGAVLTTPVNGAWEWDGNKLNFTIGGVRKRIGVFTDAAPTGGQLMIGNGTDFTLANITAGYAQTVTNGSGSITVNPDTTKVIPFIPNAEIANNTRNGYYWNKTTGKFGNQFYRNNFSVLQDYTINSNAYATINYLYTSGAGVSLTNSIVFGNPSLNIGVADNSRSTAIVAYPMGLMINSLYHSLETPSASSPGSTISATGNSSLIYVTDSDISTVTLPNIIGTTTPTANEVALGYTLTIIVSSATTVTINTHASDSIITKDVAGTSTAITCTTGATRIVELVAVGVNTWARKL